MPAVVLQQRSSASSQEATVPHVGLLQQNDQAIAATSILIAQGIAQLDASNAGLRRNSETVADQPRLKAQSEDV